MVLKRVSLLHPRPLPVIASTEDPFNHDLKSSNRLCWATFEHCQVKLVLQVLQKNRGDPECVVPQETTGCEGLIGHFFFSHYFTSNLKPFSLLFEFTP